MVHAGGRPRKVRPEEYCLCCHKKGYKRLVSAWTPGYKQTTIGSYYRFRHDDRKFFCSKCNMNECYIDDLIKEAEIKKNTQKPPDKLMQILLDSQNKGEGFRKFLFKQMTIFKTWHINNEESKKVDNAITQAADSLLYYNAVNHMIASIHELNYILIFKAKLGSKFRNDFEIEIPEIIRDIKSDIQILKGFQSKYIEKGSKGKEIKSLLEPLHQVISELDPKYGIPHRKKKKDELKQKLRHTYNYPKRGLS